MGQQGRPEGWIGRREVAGEGETPGETSTEGVLRLRLGIRNLGIRDQEIGVERERLGGRVEPA